MITSTLSGQTPLTQDNPPPRSQEHPLSSRSKGPLLFSQDHSLSPEDHTLSPRTIPSLAGQHPPHLGYSVNRSSTTFKQFQPKNLRLLQCTFISFIPLPHPCQLLCSQNFQDYSVKSNFKIEFMEYII